MVSRFLTAKVAVATLTAVVAVGGVAAAATLARSAAEHGKAKTVGSVGKDDSERGPDATGHAAAGLCRAWAAGKGSENGRKGDAKAFQALVRAAGGEDNIEAFCAAVSSTTSTSEGQSGSAGASQGLDATGAARTGLCKAWAGGGAGETSAASRERMGAGAFEALVTAAGGEANIPTFCAGTTTETEQAGSSDNPGSDASGGESTEHGPGSAPAQTEHGADQEGGRQTSDG